jgi:hypothetical protein
MKVYLDDTRKAPFGWELVKTADEAVEKLKTGKVEAIALDHDLAEEHYDPENWAFLDAYGYTEHMDRSKYKEKTGYHVVQWMVANNTFPPEIVVHTLNPVGRQDMVRALETHAPSETKITVRPGWSRYDD